MTASFNCHQLQEDLLCVGYTLKMVCNVVLAQLAA